MFIAFTNPCYSKATHFQSFSKDRETQVVLEARRIVEIGEDYFTYDFGRDVVVIYPESFRAKRFFKFVKRGRCSERE
jgi:hypothetical protein